MKNLLARTFPLAVLAAVSGVGVIPTPSARSGQLAPPRENTITAAPGLVDQGGSTLIAVGGQNDLYTLEQTTGAATAIGGALSNIGDLTSDGQSLWGVTLDGTTLMRINPQTGGVVGSVAMGASIGSITSLAFDPVSRRLYGTTTDRLYTIDAVTGAAALIAVLNVDNVFALAFDQRGNLFGISNPNRLIGINMATGNGTLIAALSLDQVFDIASRPSDNMMFAINSTTRSLHKLDTINGASTLVGPWGGPNSLYGLAFTTSGEGADRAGAVRPRPGPSTPARPVPPRPTR